MKKTITVQNFMAAAVAVLMVACGVGERPAGEGGRAGRPKPVTVKGSDTMVILGQRMAEEYMKQNPTAMVQVTGGGSGTGIAALINGTVDLAQSSRSMTEEEKQKVVQNRGVGVVERSVAIDALAVFIHGGNPLQSLTMDQVKQIYQGKITNWRELGGSDSAIILYGRESSSGTYDYFREHVLLKEDFAPRVQTLQGTAAIINAVSKDPAGIGYGGFAYANDVKLLPIAAEGKAPVAPSAETVASGEYPLARFLYFYYTENPTQAVQDFVAFTLTPEGQAVVDKVGYFPLNQGPAAIGGVTIEPVVSETNAQ
ncbi:MAG: phosphate ABC transporter substrate-binding protein [Thermoanaerobaculia bacterium]